jgi:hypothetical protein
MEAPDDAFNNMGDMYITPYFQAAVANRVAPLNR